MSFGGGLNVLCFDDKYVRDAVDHQAHHALIKVQDHDHRRIADLNILDAQQNAQINDRDNLTTKIDEPLHVGRSLGHLDRKSTRLNSSHVKISYAVFCLKKK